MKKKIIGIIVCILGCELVGGIGSLFTMPAIAVWYAGLNKASLNPPGWVFGPVWTLLFALMGIAVFLVWQRAGRDKRSKTALSAFVVQLALNVLWSILFFGMHNPVAAFVDIVILWLAIVWTIAAFWKLSRPAAWLMAPYLLWVSFAAYLNYSIVILNK